MYGDEDVAAEIVLAGADTFLDGWSGCTFSGEDVCVGVITGVIVGCGTCCCNAGAGSVGTGFVVVLAGGGCAFIGLANAAIIGSGFIPYMCSNCRYMLAPRTC